MKKHLPVLQIVQSVKPKLRKSIILHCDLDFIKAIDECIFNTLNGNLPLKDTELKKIKKFKTILRKVLKTKGRNKKREIISQNGGSFLPSLLAPIVAAGLSHFANKNETRKKNGTG